MSLRDYEQLADQARFDTMAGTRLAAERVYYEARDPLQFHERDGFEGKISRGLCVEAELGAEGTAPRGLRAPKIGFICRDRPTASVFRKSKVHHGTHGLLSGRVRCRILVSYYP